MRPLLGALEEHFHEFSHLRNLFSMVTIIAGPGDLSHLRIANWSRDSHDASFYDGVWPANWLCTALYICFITTLLCTFSSKLVQNDRKVMIQLHNARNRRAHSYQELAYITYGCRFRAVTNIVLFFGNIGTSIVTLKLVNSTYYIDAE